MKIARYRAESHVSAVIGKATPTTEARRIAKIAIIAEIAKIEKPTPTPLKHGVSGVSGGKKIARDPRQGPTATPGQAGQVARNRT